MDTERIVVELKAERDRLDAAITAIESINTSGRARKAAVGGERGSPEAFIAIDEAEVGAG